MVVLMKQLRRRSGLSLLAIFAASLSATGCGTTFLNPAFLNTTSGGQFPVTPGPSAAFVLVRALNQTGTTVEFFVTIEREKLRVDDDGNFVLDDLGNFATDPVRETVRVLTGTAGLSTDIGVLFPCGQSPVTLVGLGENLLPTDRHIAVGGEGAGGATGVGVTVENLNPLSLAQSNFNCGDTIIYRAFRSTGTPGGVLVSTFLLPGSEQPFDFAGPSTFVEFQDLLDTASGQTTP